MQWIVPVLAALILSCASNVPSGPLPVVCSDADGILFEGEANSLLHLVPEGYWEFYDFRTHTLVRVHGDCRMSGM